MFPFRLKTVFSRRYFQEEVLPQGRGSCRAEALAGCEQPAQGTRLEGALAQLWNFWIQNVEVTEGTALRCSSKKNFGDVVYPSNRRLFALILTVKCPNCMDTKYFYGSAFNCWMSWFNPSQKLSIKLPLTHSCFPQRE